MWRAVYLVSTVLSWTFRLCAISLLFGLITALAARFGPRTGKIWFFARYAFCTWYLCSLSIVFLPIFIIRNPKDVDNCRWAATYLRLMAAVVGIKFELRGSEHLTQPACASIKNFESGAVIVCNHQSAYDVVGLFDIWEHLGRCTIIAKKELMWLIPFGHAAYYAGVTFIDRSRSQDAQRVLQQTATAMREQRTKLLLYPEGTRNKTDCPEKLLPFRKGAFKTAMNAKCPIIPMIFSPYYFIRSKDYYFGTGTVIIKVLPSIDTSALADSELDKLVTDTYNKMSEVYAELSAEVNKANNNSQPKKLL
ncbi:1-acyl-sn-glycerol-3-phosphate acyltransferase beta-like [Ctenocephalides felis]|uniref:1-acyl-sn-glycerol-3-phosphate acyltransferase beta-like n=1 Tax=Ctenocephalides felis TaxID=7515 RepID=UPI000E6E17C8|nr:1-acyl-sn-glycerol-3-phosphate acyltransferase beta-like [Ctenocephalides felis]